MGNYVKLSICCPDLSKRKFLYCAGGDNLDNSLLSEILIPDLFEYKNMSDRKGKILWCDIWFVICPIGDLLCGQQTKWLNKTPFSQDLLSDLNGKGTHCPIIHITLTDVFVPAMYQNKRLPGAVPRSFQIMDNSIWNYVVPLFHDKIVGKEWSELLEDSIKSICKNYEKNLYSLKVAQEYADLNARLVKNAYLSGAHASGVSPFIFHSENVIKRRIEEEFCNQENCTLSKISDRKWRILLVDDKADAPMDNDYASNISSSWNCKNTIIKSLISKRFGINEDIPCLKCNDIVINSNSPFVINYVETIDQAKNALKEKQYDIILLDYLINEKKENRYGSELLEDIYIELMLDKEIKDISKRINKGENIKSIFMDEVLGNDHYKYIKEYINKQCDKEFTNALGISNYSALLDFLSRRKKYKIGPNGRLFFMFISAYSSAVHERLLADSLNLSEDYWHIAVGACPTNTPQLFLYNLLKLMDKRLGDSGILKLSSSEIYTLIDKIYLPKEQDLRGDSVRKRANALYQKVLKLQYHYRNILKDVDIPLGQNSNDFDTKGSVLMTNFIQNKINLGGMLEHLTQLVHLTAFGTVRQWPEMWEEYIYFKAQFEKQSRDDKDSDSVSSDKLKEMFTNIEKYILDLKSQPQ